jgi:tetraacyldisaccharide 4'-kinase
LSGRIEDRLAQRGGAIELLRVPAALFGLVVSARSALYQRRLLPVHRLDVPVVSVGNLTAGGTGKTPFVLWAVEWFAARGMRAGVLSRGYGADGAGGGDEARMARALHGGLTAVQDPDRVRGGRKLEELGVDVILLDDGFQHRRLHRDRDLVLVDATRPWGLAAPAGRGEAVSALLPRGLLRESPAALSRADAVVLTRTDQVDAARLASLEAELSLLAPGAPIVRACHVPAGLRGVRDSSRWPLERLQGRTVDLVSGIGNPEAFERTVRSTGAQVRAHRRFADHHAYSAEDLRGLGGTDIPLVTTAKDGVKISEFAPAALSLDVRLELAEGRAALEALLESIPPGEALQQRRAIHEGLHG